MWATYYYTYNPANLELANIKLFWGNFDLVVIAIILVWLTIGIIYYIALPYINGYLLIRREEMKKIENKNKIKELILMKEVQNELEKEMEETLLNAWLQKTQLI